MLPPLSVCLSLSLSLSLSLLSSPLLSSPLLSSPLLSSPLLSSPLCLSHSLSHSLSFSLSLYIYMQVVEILLKSRTCLSYRVNTMAANDLVMQGAGASVAMIDFNHLEYYSLSTISVKITIVAHVSCVLWSQSDHISRVSCQKGPICHA